MIGGKHGRMMLGLGLLAAGILLSVGCGDDDDGPTGVQPEPLVGTWDEVDYERRMTLRSSGDFQYLSLAGGAPGTVEGQGTWEGTSDEFTIHLASGQFRWLESVNNAPISFTFDYLATADTLALTFEVIDVVSTAKYSRVD